MGQEQVKPKLQIIGFGGCSASGKSTISKEVSKRLNSPFEPISGDHFFHNKIPKHEKYKWNYEVPEAVDFETIKNGLKEIKEHYNMNPFEKFTKNFSKKSWMQIPEISTVYQDNGKKEYIFIVIESFLLFYDKELCDLIDFHFFIECPHEVARERRIKRDGCSGIWYDELVWPHFEKYKGVQMKNSQAVHVDGTQPVEDSVNEIKNVIEKRLEIRCNL